MLNLCDRSTGKADHVHGIGYLRGCALMRSVRPVRAETGLMRLVYWGLSGLEMFCGILLRGFQPQKKSRPLDQQTDASGGAGWGLYQERNFRRINNAPVPNPANASEDGSGTRLMCSDLSLLMPSELFAGMRKSH